MKLKEMTWVEVSRIDRARALVVAPLGSCEQHARHLPTFTDSILCDAVAEGLESRLPNDILLLPVCWLGASDHHLPFGATVSASVDHHVEIVGDIVESALLDGFRRVLVLNGHGGNIDTMHLALRRLQPKWPDRLLASASYWEFAASEFAALATGPRKTMGHAEEFETAMMMHLTPHLVRASEMADEHPALNESLRGVSLAQDFSQMTKGGAVGYPTRANPELGAKLLSAAVDRAVEVATALIHQTITVGRLRRES